MSTTTTSSPDASDNENESQEMDNVIGEADISLAYTTNTDRNASLPFLSSAFKTSVVSENEDSLMDDFTTVQYNRRPYVQAAKAATMSPDPHNQFTDQLPYNATTATETPRLIEMPKANTGIQVEQLCPRVTNKMQGNARRSKDEVQDSSSFFVLEEVSSWKEGVSSQRPTHNFMDSSGAELGSTVASYASSVKKSLPHSQSLERDPSTRRPSGEQPSTDTSEGMVNNLKSSSTSGSSQAWSTEPVHPGRISATSTISQSFQGNVVARVLQAIPEGVCVVCDHFLQANRNRPTSISAKNKTCESCKNLNKLKYAVWNKRGYWQEMRPYPAFKVPPKVTLDVCRHFTTYRPCPKTTCTFPHGKVESAMWTLERKGGKYKLQ